MKLCGLQKLSLLDYPQKLCCTVFTGGCDLRCPFCHNASLVLRPGEDGEISVDEFFSFLDSRRGKLDGVCVSGGEPLLQPDIEAFLKNIALHGFEVKLDTNGTHPEVLEKILNNNLVDYVAMDIKNRREKYPATVGRQDFDVTKIERSVRLLRESGVPFEFRTTLVRGLHEPGDIRALGEWVGCGCGYHLQNFKDSGDIISDGLSGFNHEELRAFLEEARPFFESVELRGEG